MEHRRISMNDLVIGQPLPWDVYDSHHHLLLSRGHVIEGDQQIETLVERGLFVDAKQSPPKSNSAPPVKQRERPSALRFVNMAANRLQRLLFGMQNETDVEAKILEVVKVLTFAMDVNADVALACILLNQDSADYSVRHSIDTAIVAMEVARSLKKPPQEIQSLMAAALTMNVGMLSHQGQLQNKGEALSPDELDIIRKHPLESVTLLEQAGVKDQDWLSYVLHHHENEDGSGYPFGKSKQEIPENAKIIAIADRYCARISARSYRKSLLPNAALRDMLLANKETIDPMLASTYIKALGVYSTGTYVRLENGEIGVVTGKGSTTTTPFVHSLIGPRGAPLAFPIKRDTSKSLHGIQEVLHEEQASIRFSMQQLWGEDAAL
jgi:HD-GYP domain-containing protein (c-di-GMP phosphodiesterase class II)